MHAIKLVLQATSSSHNTDHFELSAALFAVVLHVLLRASLWDKLGLSALRLVPSSSLL